MDDIDQALAEIDADRDASEKFLPGYLTLKSARLLAAEVRRLRAALANSVPDTWGIKSFNDEA